ncbi:hypothetical protein M406DRAFT_355687 [Cryphonectria parasitica EP155]|uniref:Uncharacterized protein n=1 Tax=Cryphonectria parasitica (strain ATCC 38755 / EP155) TaxID=660469 RepID=A0A9P4Y721_CRYP1|nr:uncharacterized protein M406DRAFT_355687 [Cryphonectria parasitica EP155]KAF3767738.1 hypothetical protein M406DRAFT_355687 [Cryphonectria parasitica EP155]
MQSVPWRLRGSLLSPVTPLVCLLGGFAYTLRYRIRNLESLHQSLRLFLTVLQSCGVNLEEYGRREFELWSEEYGANHVEAMSCVRFPSGMISIYVDEEVLYPVDTIHYGPTLEDWSFESDFVQDFLATFWDMVENPPRDEIMPGTWVEDE